MSKYDSCVPLKYDLYCEISPIMKCKYVLKNHNHAPLLSKFSAHNAANILSFCPLIFKLKSKLFQTWIQFKLIYLG